MAGQWPLVVWVQDDTPEMIEYEAAQHELDSGVVMLPGDTDAPAPPGRYVRLPDERALAMTPRDPHAVFLQDTHRADEVSWVMQFDSEDQEVEVADRVYRKVVEAVEVARRGGAVPLGPSTTYATDAPTGGYFMHGVCIVARPA